MKKEDYVQAISVVSTFALIFLVIYLFQLTQTSFLFILLFFQSFGYMLYLIGQSHPQKTFSTYLYRCMGIMLILIAVLFALKMPHTKGIFF